MKKLLEKDKKHRLKIGVVEQQNFILKSIFKNLNYFTLIRWNAFLKLKKSSKNSSKISTINRCVYTVNKKRFNKHTLFSRYVFLKLIRSGDINGMQKSSW